MIGLICVAASVLVAACGNGDADRALTPDQNMDLLKFPEFKLTAQDGSAVTPDVFKGRITVVDYFFSHCPFVCVPMAQNLKQAQTELRGTGVRFLSVSVDPKHDTPERLRAYAKETGADTSTWTFATGDAATIAAMVEGSLKQTLTPDGSRSVPLGDGETMDNIGHPSQFILVGPKGEVLGVYLGLVPEQVDALIKRARAAAGAVG